MYQLRTLGRTLAHSVSPEVLLDLAAARLLIADGDGEYRIELTRSGGVTFDPPKLRYLIGRQVEVIRSDGVPHLIDPDGLGWAARRLGASHPREVFA